MNYAELPNEQINELIATKVMKWHRIGVKWYDKDEVMQYNVFNAQEMPFHEEWNPVEDLNQCYQAEDKITYANLAGKYMLQINLNKWDKFNPPTRESNDWILTHATARTRCVAMLMAVENE